MKTAIVLLADPKGGDEALGRLFNALAATYDLQQRGAPVELVLQGAATRWVGVVTQPDHPAHALYQAVARSVAGVSCGCSDVFGARAEAEKGGFSLLTANAVPGTSGLASLASYVLEGTTVLTF
jgi:hypothetical protein